MKIVYQFYIKAINIKNIENLDVARRQIQKSIFLQNITVHIFLHKLSQIIL